MKLNHTILAGLLAAFCLSPAMASSVPQGDGAQGEAAAPMVEPEPSMDEPAEKPAEKVIDVDALIAEFNASQAAPRTFTAEEREWISQGLPAEEVERVHKGYSPIPSSDPNVVIYRRDGKTIEIRSEERFGTPPAAQNVAPFAQEIDERASIWMPKAASSTATEVDAMFDFIMWTSYIFSAIILVVMVYLVIRYRRRPGVRADQSHTHNTPLEITWSVIPTILVAIMFWGGYVTFLDMRTPPPDSMKVNVNAYRWGWNFQYQNGVESPQEFHVPANTPIELSMTSSDVIHSFHVPVYRQKSDILPNRYTQIWFDSGEPGEYRVYCSEYCGKDHANMYAKLVVESREDYEAWLVKAGNWMVDENGVDRPPLEIGELTYKRRGCSACHSVDGKALTGPTFAGLWGLERKFTDGATRIADDNYIAQSITDPYSQLVEGYGKQMTVYSPMLPPKQITGIIAYIESLKDVPRQN